MLSGERSKRWVQALCGLTRHPSITQFISLRAVRGQSLLPRVTLNLHPSSLTALCLLSPTP